MAKFTSLDGIDSTGVRAEVVVQTGTGTIKELNPRGSANSDGSYRNVEVVFTPDNPKLVRKVYGLLDTTASDLWSYIQQAHDAGTQVSFRIESQRRRHVERTIPFAELNHSEDVIRALVAIDALYSHEALTNPEEDPTSRRSPSALTQPVTASTTQTLPQPDAGEVLATLATARQHGLAESVIGGLQAIALTRGATLEQVLAAGVDTSTTPPRPQVQRVRAVEEKPWTLYNSDGRINAGSYWVAHVSTAQRFAREYVNEQSTAEDTNTAVQAYTLTRAVLSMSDEVAGTVVGQPVDRQKNSYNRVMSAVMAEITARGDVPPSAEEEAWDVWTSTIVDGAVMSLTQVLHIASQWLEPDEGTPARSSGGAGGEGDELGKQRFQARAFPREGSRGFQRPTVATVERLKELCTQAGVAEDPAQVVDWLESLTGQRSARKIHEPVLVALVTHYEATGPEQVAWEVQHLAGSMGEASGAAVAAGT